MHSRTRLKRSSKRSLTSFCLPMMRFLMVLPWGVCFPTFPLHLLNLQLPFPLQPTGLLIFFPNYPLSLLRSSQRSRYGHLLIAFLLVSPQQSLFCSMWQSTFEIASTTLQTTMTVCCFPQRVWLLFDQTHSEPSSPMDSPDCIPHQCQGFVWGSVGARFFA